MSSCHGESDVPISDGSRKRIALIGSPNAGKTSVFNGLTGLRAKTANYPGVTVSRSVGSCKVPALVTANGDRAKSAKHTRVDLEDLPGTYSLDPISPDEKVVADLLSGELKGAGKPDAALVVVDVTVMPRALALVAETLNLGIPVAVVLTMTDEMSTRGGHVDVEALETAIGVPVRAVIGTKKSTLEPVRALLADPDSWSRPLVPPPAEDSPERSDWVASVVKVSGYRPPTENARTTAIDRLLLHPVLGTIVFFIVMFLLFQLVFTVAAPFQDAIETFFGWLGDLSSEYISNPVLADFVASALLGGVGGVIVFVPQILLIFLVIALLENIGYMSRAAFLTDRVMSAAGLEGRAFVAMLSSFACAVPGIMATRTMPSSRDRIATAITAPLMTCSARIPVFVLLTGLLISQNSRMWIFSTQGVVMFGLYLLGGLSALVAAAIFKRTRSLRSGLLPFYMEMPPYRVPSAKSVLTMMWDSTSQFLKKVGGIILATTVILWVLMSLPTNTDGANAANEAAVSEFVATDEYADLAAEDPGAAEEQATAIGDAAGTSYVIDHSAAAAVGKFVQPVFAPLGYDWQINIAILGSFAAREVVVSTLGQIAAAEDPEEPDDALGSMTRADGSPLFTTATSVSLLLFFVYALQCMSTVGAIRRETNTWKWPLVAWGYMFVLAWVAAFIGYHVTNAITG